MHNPIPKNNLFVTPKSLDEVLEFINSMPTNEQAQAMTAVMFTLNWAHDQFQELQLSTPQGRIAYLRSKLPA
jgi:hypothetical protein